MKEKRVLPVLFNTEMVKAILDGRKTETRRPIKSRTGRFTVRWRNVTPDVKWVEESYEYGGSNGKIINPKYSVDDVLYIRETFYKDDSCTLYKASNYEHATSFSGRDGWKTIKWKPSIHMPKEAARIFLKVTEVKVERLNEMTIDSYLKEGMKAHTHNRYIKYKFEELWNSIYKDYQSDGNPWVFVYKFVRCDREGNVIKC